MALHAEIVHVHLSTRIRLQRKNLLRDIQTFICSRWLRNFSSTFTQKWGIRKGMANQGDDPVRWDRDGREPVALQWVAVEHLILAEGPAWIQTRRNGVRAGNLFRQEPQCKFTHVHNTTGGGVFNAGSNQAISRQLRQRIQQCCKAALQAPT